MEAIHIATSNGAQFLGEFERVGTLEAGKAADIVVIRGNPAANFAAHGLEFQEQGQIDPVLSFS
jgi:imidazolonepropionase-like amidohydrolase